MMPRRSSGWRDPREYPDFGVQGMTVPKAVRLEAARQRYEEAEQAAAEREEMMRRREEEHYFEVMGLELLGDRRAQLEQERKDKVELVGRGKAALREAQDEAMQARRAMEELAGEMRLLEKEQRRVDALGQKVEMGYVRPEGWQPDDEDDENDHGGEGGGGGGHHGAADVGVDGDAYGGSAVLSPDTSRVSMRGRPGVATSPQPPSSPSPPVRDDRSPARVSVLSPRASSLPDFGSLEVRTELRYIAHLPPPVENPEPPVPRPRVPKTAAERSRSLRDSRRAVDAIKGPSVDAYDYALLGAQSPGVVGFNVDTKATLPGLREDLMIASAVQREQGDALFREIGAARGTLDRAEHGLGGLLEANTNLRVRHETARREAAALAVGVRDAEEDVERLRRERDAISKMEAQRERRSEPSNLSPEPRTLNSVDPKPCYPFNPKACNLNSKR